MRGLIKRLRKRWLLLAGSMVLAVMAQADVPYSQGESLRVIGSDVVFRDGPHRQAAVIKTLNLYDHLEFLGEYTVEPVTIKLRGESVSAPYLYARANDGTRGWVFGGLVEEDTGASLFERTASLIQAGDPVADVRQLYGSTLTRHISAMRSPYTQGLLSRLDTSEALEFYSIRTGEGIAFGLRDGEVVAIRIRQDRIKQGALRVYWRSVEGYLSADLRTECHQSSAPANCSDYPQ